MHRIRLFPDLIVVAACALACNGGESAWPQFRGPRGDGTSRATLVPQDWSATKGLAWSVAVPGRGRSSPVVEAARIWLTSAVERQVQRTRIGPDDMQTAEHVSLRALALEAVTGKLLWEKVLFEVEKPDPVHWLNSWATPTPVIRENRLYCDFGTFGTACLDATEGTVLWQKRLPSDHQVGPGSSPVIFGESLILVRDGRDAQYVTALDLQTGAERWKTDRPPINAGSPNLKKSFVTPLLCTSGGRTQLVAPGAHWVVAYEPGTGRELWRVRHGDGFSIGTGPAFGHGLVFIGTGCFKAQLLAITLDGAGDVTGSAIQWRSLRQIPVMSSPVLVGDELYWVSDDGMACCADARTGEMHWQERLGSTHLASPLAAEGRVYFFSMDGRTTVVKASRTFEKLSENELPGPVVATPAMVDGALLLRSDSTLYRIGK